MTSVIFLKSWSCYNKGQIAGFLPVQADVMIAKGIAAAYAQATAPVRKGAMDKAVKK